MKEENNGKSKRQKWEFIKDNIKKEKEKRINENPIAIIRVLLVEQICFLCSHDEASTHNDNLLPHCIPSFAKCPSKAVAAYTTFRVL